MTGSTSFGLELPFGSAAEALQHSARRWPNVPAVYAPTGRDVRGRARYLRSTFRMLDEDSTAVARGLLALGLTPGSKVVLMVPPSLELFELAFGLFKAGIVPVLVDPGLGVRRLSRCFEEAAPTAFIGVPRAQVARLLFGWGRATVAQVVTVGRRGPWGGVGYEEVKALGARQPSATSSLPALDPEALAGVLFTSGSTGVPKGVEYAHRHFVAQVELLRRTFDIRPGEVDLPTFPLFGLFDPALGITAVLPDMDATRPASVDPSMVFEAAEHFGVTHMFASPALLDTVSRRAQATGFQFSTLRRVLSAGAPMTPAILERAQAMLPDAEIHTPYGATEALPVSSVGSRFLLAHGVRRTREGAGVCVGVPVPSQDVQLIAVDDGPLPQWGAARVVEVGEIGEITVRGPSVTARYHGRPEATALSKIDHQDGGPPRHRMGDLGYFDAEGRLWFCGRKSQRVRLARKTLHTVPIEEVFNGHPAVKRTALVGVRKGDEVVPVLCVERERDHRDQPFSVVARELTTLGAERELTRDVQRFVEHPHFPVDIRHNAKIFREQLTTWAQAHKKVMQ